MTDFTDYRCPHDLSELTLEGGQLRAKNGKVYDFHPDSSIPIFASDSDDANEFTTNRAAEIHDNALSWLFRTFNVDEARLRRHMVSKLDLKKGGKVLITSVGAGNDLPYLAELVGESGVIFAQDYAKQMLLAAVTRAKTTYNLGSHDIRYSISDATQLPFPDDAFDAVYHFGGLNLFSDIKKGMSEMDRVVKPGGRVVVGDEGIAPWLKCTEIGEMLINNNPLYACNVL